MAKTGIRLVFQLETRDKYKHVDCELGMTVEGRELPNASVLGSAMEQAVELIQARVKESYEVVPPRPDIPQPAPLDALNAVNQQQQQAAQSVEPIPATPVAPPQVAQQPPVQPVPVVSGEQLPPPANPVPFG